MEWYKLKEKMPTLKLGDYIMLEVFGNKLMPDQEYYQYIKGDSYIGFMSQSMLIDKRNFQGTFMPDFDYHKPEGDSYWRVVDKNKETRWRIPSKKEIAILNLQII